MLPNAQPRPRPREFEQEDKKRELSALERSVRIAVQQRDGRRCRCCGRKDRLHHHHLVFRSKGGAWSSENILLLCSGCHALLHARQLWIFGKNADKRLTFELDERAVIDVFGTKPVPRDVRLVKAAR